jgi:hypothetical protein
MTETEFWRELEAVTRKQTEAKPIFRFLSKTGGYDVRRWPSMDENVSKITKVLQMD